MSSATDKIKGYANQAAGNVKHGVGKVVGSEEMQIKGGAQAAQRQGAGRCR